MIGEGIRSPELILLGLPKTGTTWLASVLNQHPGVNLFDESDKIEQLWARPGGLPVVIAESVTDPLFLPSVDRRADALEALRQRLPGYHHLLFLREPADWILSLYRQYVKRGGYRPFREFFGEGEDPIVSPHYLDYGRLIEEIQEAIPGPLTIANHACMRADPKAFLAEITGAFGEPSPLKGLEEGIPESAYLQRANVGLKGRGARWLRALNLVRRSRWNPHGWASWKRAERLPWHLLGTEDRDLVDRNDRDYLTDILARYADWERWQARFAERCLLVHE